MRVNVRQLIHISVHACTHMYVNVYACKRVSCAQNRFGYRPGFVGVRKLVSMSSFNAPARPLRFTCLDLPRLALRCLGSALPNACLTYHF